MNVSQVVFMAAIGITFRKVPNLLWHAVGDVCAGNCTISTAIWFVPVFEWSFRWWWYFFLIIFFSNKLLGNFRSECVFFSCESCDFDDFGFNSRMTNYNSKSAPEQILLNSVCGLLSQSEYCALCSEELLAQGQSIQNSNWTNFSIIVTMRFNWNKLGLNWECVFFWIC